MAIDLIAFLNTIYEFNSLIVKQINNSFKPLSTVADLDNGLNTGLNKTDTNHDIPLTRPEKDRCQQAIIPFKKINLPQ